MRLLLIRHGETVWNADTIYRGRADVPLSAKGKDQADLLGRRLAREGIAALYTSPLGRARETALAIGRHAGLTPRVEPELTDIDCGEWEGLNDLEVKERYPDVRQAWLSTPHLVQLPGGESLNDVSARVGRVLAAVSGEQGAIALVSHRVVNKVAICALLGLDNSHFWDIKIDLAGVTEFEVSAKHRVLVRHNDTSHLCAPGDGRPADF
jgi:broad specificity phosphatase PhoE